MNNQTSISNEMEPTAGELSIDELDAVNGGGVLSTLLTNLANMRHEMMKSIVNNLRG